MDEVDLTAIRLEMEMARLLRLRRACGPAPTGECLWCGAPLPHPLRWCDVACRDDWERRHAREPR